MQLKRRPMVYLTDNFFGTHISLSKSDISDVAAVATIILTLLLVYIYYLQ
jgi:hypothetical protein